jgi:hypothetical protein
VRAWDDLPSGDDVRPSQRGAGAGYARTPGGEGEVTPGTLDDVPDPRVSDVDRRLEGAILELLGQRARTATICPSDAARAVGDEDSWRDLMEPARRAARRLVDRGEVEITQAGHVVDPSTAKGPIRIRRR